MKTQQELEAMVREILGDDYRELRISKYTVSEDIKSHECRLLCELRLAGSEETLPIEGRGVGFIDALFKGLKGALSNDYPSLDNISFVDFTTSGDFNDPSQGAARTEVAGLVRLVVENTSGQKFEFAYQSRSMSASCVAVVASAVEHFVNAEHAVLRVYDWIEEASAIDKPELVEQYTQTLAELVKNASHSETIERKRSESGIG